MKLFKNKKIIYNRLYSKPNVGFIGLGNMGGKMAPHLLRKNFTDKLFVYDINTEAISKIEKEGAKKCNTIEELSEKSEIVITMV